MWGIFLDTNKHQNLARLRVVVRAIDGGIGCSIHVSGSVYPNLFNFLRFMCSPVYLCWTFIPLPQAFAIFSAAMCYKWKTKIHLGVHFCVLFILKPLLFSLHFSKLLSLSLRLFCYFFFLQFYSFLLLFLPFWLTCSWHNKRLSHKTAVHFLPRAWVCDFHWKNSSWKAS